MKEIIAESISGILNEFVSQYEYKPFDIGEIRQLIDILKENPLEKKYEPHDYGFCTVQRVNAHDLLPERWGIVNTNDDGTEDLYHKVGTLGDIELHICGHPNTHWLIEDGYYYQAWKEQ